MIWSVVMRRVPLPRMCSMSARPRSGLLGADAFFIRTASRSISNTTSVFGSRPSFSRMSIGIVTCPLLVILTVILLPVRVLHLLLWILIAALTPEFWLLRGPHNLDAQECSRTLLGKERIDGSQHPSLPTGHGLGDCGLESQRAMKIQGVPIEVIAAGEIDS